MNSCEPCSGSTLEKSSYPILRSLESPFHNHAPYIQGSVPSFSSKHPVSTHPTHHVQRMANSLHDVIAIYLRLPAGTFVICCIIHITTSWQLLDNLTEHCVFRQNVFTTLLNCFKMCGFQKQAHLCVVSSSAFSLYYQAAVAMHTLPTYSSHVQCFSHPAKLTRQTSLKPLPKSMFPPGEILYSSKRKDERQMPYPEKLVLAGKALLQYT